MNINWDSYKDKIIALTEEGLSSKEIAVILSKTENEIHENTDRSIRSALSRWREEGTIQTQKKPAKVLLFDIETAPMIAYTWSRFPKMIGDHMLKQDWYVINWAAKWLFDDKMMSGVVTPKESVRQDDRRIVTEMWNLLNEADIVITHNGDKFDIRMLNGRFIKYGLNLPMPYQSIDTYKAARKRLNLPSLKLNYIAEFLGVGKKMTTSFDWWVKSMEGSQEHLSLMDIYCQQDVKVLEEVYLQLRPFIQPHPNLGLYIESDVHTCPSCGSSNLKKEGTYNTAVNQYDAFRCGDCGSITRSRKSRSTNENVTRSVPR